MKKLLLALSLLALMAAGCTEIKPYTQEDWLNVQRDSIRAQAEYEANIKAEKAAWCNKNRTDKYAQEMCKPEPHD